MPHVFSNNPTSTLAGPILAADLAISIQPGDAAKFPSLVAGQHFRAVIVNALLQYEIVKVTARAGAVLTVLRAQEGTTALAFAVGVSISQRLTAATLADLQNLNDLPDPALSRTNLGLGNVDNTSDANKPVSVAQNSAIGLRLEKAQNLNDLPNKATARANLDVLSVAEVLQRLPAGTIMMWPSLGLPPGWLERNGAAILRTGAGAALFNAIGTFFGAGNGTTTFNIPDDRGNLERGWDHGRGTLDAGRAFGSEQLDAIEAHLHLINPPTANTTSDAHTHTLSTDGSRHGANGASGSGFYGSDGDTAGNSSVRTQTTSSDAHLHAVSIPNFNSGLTGGAETRVRNRAYLPIIKL